MKINGIVLQNFGSYEGINQFDMSTSNEKNIILIGGKNGAGKTTLFTAIRLCLYGCLSMGHKAINSVYYRNINKLINNTAKLNKSTTMSVFLNIDIENAQGIDTYLLKRSWKLNDSITESFNVAKNGVELSGQEINDFEKFILSIVPPELFNLYFFDGERIADYFLNDGSNERIRKAFMTLCGYDTFDIMKKNFKRIYSRESDGKSVFDEYLNKKEILKNKLIELDNYKLEKQNVQNIIEKIESDINLLDLNYSKNGGITNEEWNRLNSLIKEEEKKRDELNSNIKLIANDVVPFLMIKNQLLKLKQQINKESNDSKYTDFCEILDMPEINSILDNLLIEKIKKVAANSYLSGEYPILNLSPSQNIKLLYFIDKIQSYDSNELKKIKKEIAKSKKRCEKYRKILEQSDMAFANEYTSKRNTLIENKNKNLEKQLKLEQKLFVCEQEYQILEVDFNKIKSKVEDDLKKESINDISAKAIIMLEKLQNSLYSKQINKVEKEFRKMIKTLMRKNKFIDDIMIDENFVIHVYRKEEFSLEKILKLKQENTREQLISLLGEKAVEKFDCSNNDDTKMLSIEIDKTSLSQGEKQIFVMALYYSLIKLSKHSMPFIIDTPFARIDSEHRRNISTHFFNKLNGQLFILSTNEEINKDHVDILENKVMRSYLLENNENKKTTVIKNKYFEVN